MASKFFSGSQISPISGISGFRAGTGGEFSELALDVRAPYLDVFVRHRRTASRAVGGGSLVTRRNPSPRTLVIPKRRPDPFRRRYQHETIDRRRGPSLGILFGSAGTALATHCYVADKPDGAGTNGAFEGRKATRSTPSSGICPTPPTSEAARPTASSSSRRSRQPWLRYGALGAEGRRGTQAARPSGRAASIVLAVIAFLPFARVPTAARPEGHRQPLRHSAPLGGARGARRDALGGRGSTPFPTWRRRDRLPNRRIGHSLAPGDALSARFAAPSAHRVCFFLQRAIEPTVEEAWSTTILGML